MIKTSIELEHICHACGRSHTRSFAMARNTAPIKVSTEKPNGWTEVSLNGKDYHYCGDHKVVVLCDGMLSVRAGRE